ncbi:MAG: UDP-2,3-diacylglucosamine diphosphatase [Bacteriovoracia bacterium]
MKLAAISDVHIKSPNDEAYKLLLSFFNHPQVLTADYILLLGDIFDLMVGPHDEYLDLYSEIFHAMGRLHQQGKKIYYFEGNHDVHLEKLFKKIWNDNEIVLSYRPVVEEIEGKTYYFSHGDEHEIENIGYHRYIRFIRSQPLKIVADYFMPYSVLNFFGERASKLSRKKGSRKFDPEEVKNRFRSGVQTITKGRYDFVLGGHSHVQDEFKFSDSETVYLNNGFALRTNTFLLIENHEPKFVSLT